MLSEEEYYKMISWVPLLCVDIIISNQRGEILLGKRNNAPYKGEWFFIGGRIWKWEDPKKAAVRQVNEETGIVLDRDELRFVSIRSRIFKEIDRHDIVIIYEVVVPNDVAIQANEEHNKISFFRELPELNQEAVEALKMHEALKSEPHSS